MSNRLVKGSVTHRSLSGTLRPEASKMESLVERSMGMAPIREMLGVADMTQGSGKQPCRAGRKLLQVFASGRPPYTKTSPNGTARRYATQEDERGDTDESSVCEYQLRASAFDCSPESGSSQ